ncbi:MAG: UvrB/UvrC motif-containing protein [Oscillospiraceae bacterium]|jgi:protein arginine kinase activator|nr:UvrB/UvrC motif-containing protein [Oscillospiraceae bacterium]
MKCQNCGKNEVNFYYSSNINGTVTETRLCSECAEKLGYGGGAMHRAVAQMLEAPFGGLTGVFGSPFAPSLFGGAASPALTPPWAEPAQSPAAPARVDDALNRRRELNILREQMRLAADRDEFERAAELRDEIKKLEAAE